MKKDILAAITFLATGFLFYVTQTGGQSDEYFTSSVGCDAPETVWVNKAAPEAPPPVTLDSSGQTRDS